MPVQHILHKVMVKHQNPLEQVKSAEVNLESKTSPSIAPIVWQLNDRH